MPTSNENMTALYLRVSTQEQAVDGYSIEATRQILSSECRRLGRKVYKVYIDAGVSGAVQDRQGLASLLADAKRGCFSEVLVWRVSRVSRKLAHLLSILEELKEYGVTLRSYKEQFDANSPMGQFIVNMTGAVAEMERASWMESSRIASESRSRQGKWNGGTVLGYQSVTSPEGNSSLAIIPEEAIVVAESFTCYLKGWGYKKVVDYLNQSNYCGKNGKRFSISTVRHILTNPIYAGFVRYKGVISPGEHEPIISQEVWQQVHDMMTQHSRLEKTHDREYLLNGILCCPECGKNMIAVHSKNRRKDGTYRINYYYTCSTYANKGKTACHPNAVNADKAEQAVLRWFHDAVKQPFIIKDIAETMNARQVHDTEVVADAAAIEKQLAGIDKKLNDYLQRYENDTMSRDDFLTLSKKLKSEKQLLQVELEGAKAKLPVTPAVVITVQQVKRLLKQLNQVITTATIERKREILKAWISHVTVSKDGQIANLELQFDITAPNVSSSEAIL